MVEAEYVVDIIQINYEGVDDVYKFYEFIRTTAEQLGYAITEKEHDESGAKKFSVKSKAEKVVDDYTKYVIKLGVVCNYENVEVKKKKMHKGDFKLKIKGLIERDFQDKWASPSKRFFKGIYDKFIAIGKKKDQETELKEDIYTITEKVKRYFGMHKL